jgi:hypothetical protein
MAMIRITGYLAPVPHSQFQILTKHYGNKLLTRHSLLVTPLDEPGHGGA